MKLLIIESITQKLSMFGIQWIGQHLKSLLISLNQEVPGQLSLCKGVRPDDFGFHYRN